MLQKLRDNWRMWLAGLVVLILLVMLACWHLWAPAPKNPEVYAPPVKVVDGSVILEKRPDAQAKPKQIIPPGAKVERVVSVTIQPRKAVAGGLSVGTRASGSDRDVAPNAKPTAGEQSPASQLGEDVQSGQGGTATECPPVTVDMTLTRAQDGTRRVQASSPDGEVIAGVDIPVEDAGPPPAPKLWAAGAVFDPFRRTVGAFVDRDMAFLRLGLQVNQRNEGELPTQVWIKAGVRW